MKTNPSVLFFVN